MSIEGQEEACWTWSGGLSCAGSISFAGSRSRSWCAGRGWRGTRSGRRCGRRRRRRSACPERPSKLDPFKDEIHRLLQDDPKLPGVRVRELIEPLGFEGGKTIVDDYLREVRPLFLQAADASADGLSAGGDLPVGSVGAVGGRCRSVTARFAARGSSSRVLGYSRAGAGALVFSKEAPDVLWGMARCLWSLGALPELLVWDREGCLHAGGGRPTDSYAAFCGQLPVDWYFCEAADPQAKGWSSGCRDTWRRTSSPAGGSLTTSTSSCSSTTWFVKANARTHKTLRCPAGRPARGGAGGDAAAARAGARHRPAVGDPGAARPAPAL